MGRYLFLTQTYPRTPEDTAGPFIRELARGLVRGGDRVTVLAPHARGLAGTWSDGGVEVETFRYAPAPLEVLGYGRSLHADERARPVAAAVAPLYLLSAAAAVRRRARLGFDLAHLHWIVPNGVALALPGVARASVRWAVGLHGSDVFMAEKGWARPLARRALERAELLTGCSQELVDRVRALGFEGDRWRVIPYGVDVAKFSPDTARRSLWRERLSIPSAATVILGVGRMATKKGFQDLVEIVPELLGAHPATHLILAGGGDLEPRFRAATAELESRVHFPGSVGHDALPDLYRSADLFVLPAVHDRHGNVDGLPNVILEAMASRLPVVATSISGIPLAITDGVEGLLIGESDRPALRAALARLIDDPGLRSAMGNAGRSKAELHLTWDAVARRYREAYRDAGA